MSQSGRAALAVVEVNRALAVGRAWMKSNGHTRHKDRCPDWFETLAANVADLIEAGPVSIEEAREFYRAEPSAGQCLNPSHLHGPSAPVTECRNPDPYGQRGT